MSPKPLTPETFAPYGELLRRDPEGEDFQALFTDSTADCGWRVALLHVPPGPLKQVHRHPDSEECFAPLSGNPLIAVALPETPEDIQVFQLNEPICMRRYTWHQIFTEDSTPASVFIAENAEISGEVFLLP
jgi:ureidoglycolate hydrolase